MAGIWGRTRLIQLLTALFIGAVLLAAQEATPMKRGDGAGSAGDRCLMRLRLAKQVGFPVILSAQEFYKRAIHRVMPRLPSSCRCEGAVIVKLLVDEKGEVSCVERVKGHPLLVIPALKAMGEWRFKPLQREGDLVPFIGEVTVRFASSRVQVSEQ
jgi:hypothetical protein